MIEDPELRALFKAESEEHLHMLENGLLHLEAEPNDGAAMLEELFRSAHSLKGAARMLGVDGVETLAHHFEDQLGAARHGHIVLTPAITDRLYRGVDAMRRLAREASDGEPALVDIPLALAQLRGEARPDTAEAEEALPDTPLLHEEGHSDNADSENGRLSDSSLPQTTPSESNVPDVSTGQEAEESPLPQQSDRKETLSKRPNEVSLVASAMSVELEDSSDKPSFALAESLTAWRDPQAESKSLDTAEMLAANEPQAPVSPTAFKIETIRVEPYKLDALMTLAGEMTVTTARIARVLTVIDDLTALSEEWTRAARMERNAPAALPNGSAKDTHHSSPQTPLRAYDKETDRLERLGQLLDQLEQTSDEGLTRLGVVAGALDEAIRSLRLLPFATIFNLFPRLVRDLSREQKKEVRLVIEGGAINADKHLLEEIKDPLMHIVRNAIDHGIETPDERISRGKPREATLRLCAFQRPGRMVLEITDDGRGLNEEAIRGVALRKELRTAAELAAMSPQEVYLLIFEPGFSTSPLITSVSGRGVGLDVVRTNIERLKGTINVASTPGQGCTFRLETPLTLATTRVLLVRVAQRSYALPVDAIQETALISPQAIFSLEGRPTIRRESEPIPTARLSDLLELPPAQGADPASKANRERGGTESPLPSIFLAIGAQRLGLFVDALLDEQEVILKPFGGMLRRVRNVLGATILSTGEICMVLNPQDLMKSAQKKRVVPTETKPIEEVARKKVILLAEDSITTRTQEKRILEGAGYAVVTAVDGADAFSKLGTQSFDAVVSDVEMPNMDGLTLAAHIRQDAKYRELPIILVTSLASDEDRKRGVAVGASAYLTKGTFEQKALLDALRRLV